MTPEQIDRVLPRAATWPPRIYDMTDTDERREACEWVAGIINAVETPANTEDGWRRLAVHLLAERQQFLDSQWKALDSALCAPESDENAERVSVDPGNDTGAHSGSPWPPPAKGTHESDLECDCAPYIDGETYDTFEAAMLWSKYGRTPDHPPAPGIRYHGRDDER